METKNLGENISLRLMPGTRTKINFLVLNSTGVDDVRKYESESHFIRCAIQKLITEEIKNHGNK